MAEAAVAPEVNLRSHLRVLGRRKNILALVVVLVVGSTIAASLLQTPLYRGEVKVLLERRGTDSLFEQSSGSQPDPARAIETEIQVVKSEPVHTAVRRKFGAVSRVEASAVGTSDVIRISAQSNDPKRAGAIAKAFAASYIEFRRSQAVNDLTQAGKKIQAKIADFQREIDALDAPAGATTANRGLTTRRDNLVAQQALFRQRLDELQVEAELRTGDAQLVTRGAVPVKKVRPTPLRSGIVALAVGLILGGGLAFLVEYLDDSIRNRDDLARLDTGVPVLGLVPLIRWGRKDARPIPVTVAEPGSPPAEAYRSLRTALQFLGVHRPPRVFQITSPDAGDGKTSTLSNLGVVLAQAGQRVVMVDCDLRHPALNDYFGLPNDEGFTSALLGQTPLALATSPVPGVENLWLLPSGPLPPNPSELLSDKKTAELLGALQDEYDVVLVDCPPVLPVADAVALSAWVDATLLIVAAGTTTRTGVQRAHEQLRQGSAPLVGTVLNRATEESQYGYGYRYQYRQPASDGRRKRKGAGRDGAPAPQPSRTGTSRRDGRGRLPADATPAAPSDQARPPSDIGAAPPPN